jgi:F-type H+-transporting ATPase subunit delta
MLFALAQRHEGLEAYAEGVEVVARLLDENARIRLFLETPRISDADKKAAVRGAFEGKVPPDLVRFLLVTIDKRRQRLLRRIARAFRALLDEHYGREHVEVTVARPLDDGTLAGVVRRLSQVLGKEAVPHVRTKPSILGGIVIRTGDTIYDGSVRRRLEGMRRQLMRARIPAGPTR